MSAVGSLLGGGPSGDDVRSNIDYLRNPNQGNYRVKGIPEYQSALSRATAAAHDASVNGRGGYDPNAAGAGLGQQAAATGLIAQTAAGNGPSLAKANMLAGLAQQNNAIASQAMTNQGNTAGGLSQRNLLNAQANANNNYVNQAGVSSVAEQLGAQANYASAANAQAQGQMANTQNASQAGLAQNQQGLQAAQIAAQNATAGQNANWQQTQANMGYDAANQATGVQAANIGLQGTGADASQLGAIGKTAGNVVAGAAMLSDEACKTQKEAASSNQISSMLQNVFAQNSAAAPAAPAAAGQDGMLHAGGGIMPMGGAAHHDYGGLDVASMLGKFGGAQNAGAAANAAGGSAGGVSSLLSGLGSVASDERCKQAMGQPTDRQLGGFMDSMKPSTFEYKDQSYSPGQHLGVMAQDVDNSKVGNDMVQDAGGIKSINVPKALGATLASLAYLNDKVDALGKKKKVSTNA